MGTKFLADALVQPNAPDMGGLRSAELVRAVNLLLLPRDID